MLSLLPVKDCVLKLINVNVVGLLLPCWEITAWTGAGKDGFNAAYSPGEDCVELRHCIVLPNAMYIVLPGHFLFRINCFEISVFHSPRVSQSFLSNFDDSF